MVRTRIRDLREDRDWTQTELADRLKISRSAYSILIALADLYQVSVDYLLFRTDFPGMMR